MLSDLQNQNDLDISKSSFQKSTISGFRNSAFAEEYEPTSKEEESLTDTKQIYMRSYQELSKVFHEDFPDSDFFKKMVLLLNENMIEYRFMQHAGLFEK